MFVISPNGCRVGSWVGLGWAGSRLEGFRIYCDSPNLIVSPSITEEFSMHVP